MKVLAYARHTTPGGRFNYDACEEFERLLRAEWPAITYVGENTIDAIEIHIDNDAVADMTVRQVWQRLQSIIDEAHKRAEDWDWLHFDVEGL